MPAYQLFPPFSRFSLLPSSVLPFSSSSSPSNGGPATTAKNSSLKIQIPLLTTKIVLEYFLVSFSLLYSMDPAFTIKAIAHQWDECYTSEGSSSHLASREASGRPTASEDKWKQALLRSREKWTYDESLLISEQNDSLLEHRTDGTIPHDGTIRRREYTKSRVVGYGAGSRSIIEPRSQYQSHSSIASIDEFMQQLRQKIKEIQERAQTLLQELDQLLEMSARIQHDPPSVIRVSTKESTDQSGDIGFTSQCELYVEDNSSYRLVALGKCFNWDTILHNEPLPSLVKVMVEKVCYADAEIPISTSEVATVAQALHTFVAWPKHLVKLTSNILQQHQINLPVKQKNILSIRDSIVALKEVATTINTNPIKVPWDVSIFPKDNVSLDIYMSDLLEIVSGNQELSISVMYLWIMFLVGLCVDEEKYDTYGFLDPQLIQLIDNKAKMQTHIISSLLNGHKKVYFFPFKHKCHWQLLVISVQDHTAAWLCSLHKEPPSFFQEIVDCAYSGYNILNGGSSRTLQKLTWMNLQCNKQNEHYECAYYIMHWMTIIVQANIYKDWDKFFTETRPLELEAMDYMRALWARYLVTHYNTLD